MKLPIVLPIFNDWQSFGSLLKDLGEQQFARLHHVCVTAIDDRSYSRKLVTA